MEEPHIKLFQLLLYNLYNLTVENRNIQIETLITNYPDIQCFKNSQDYDPKDVCLSVWWWYMFLNGIFIYKNRLYQKLNNTLISYKFFDEVCFLDEKFDEIYVYFLKKFPMHFKNLNVINLKRSGLPLLENRILNDVNRFNLNITLRYDLMEFYDGIYSIKLDKFLRRDRIERDNLGDSLEDLCTIKYYDRNYKHLNLNTA